MRIDFSDTTPRKSSRPARSGPAASSVWTLTGVALMAACAHDEAGSFLESGGGETGAATSSAYTALAALVAIGLTASAGGGSSGGSGGDARYSYQLADTNAQESSPAGYQLSAGGAPSRAEDQRFTPSNPDDTGVVYEATLPDGTGSRPTPRMMEEGARFHETSFNYNRMLEGSYGTLYYNNGGTESSSERQSASVGRWVYEADPSKVNPLRSGETRQEEFLISEIGPDGTATPQGRLEIAINGLDERSEGGRATWADSTDSDAVKVGDTLTVTLTDSDGIPTAGGSRPQFDFFHASNTSGADRKAIAPEHSSVTAADTGVVEVAQEHVGRHIGVDITYTDINGNSESVTAVYANPLAGVAANDAPGVAAFDPSGRPVVGTGRDITVRLEDPNGVPDSVSYQFFYADNNDPNNLGTKVNIGNPDTDGTPNAGPITRTNNADGVDGNADDHVSHFATLTDIPGGADGKYIGVDITYRDAQGSADDTARATMSVTVSGTQQSRSTARNYGPEIMPADHSRHHLYDPISVHHRGEYPHNTLYFGERGFANDPQHTPQNELRLSIFNLASENVHSLAEVPNNPLNYIWDYPHDGNDYSYQTEYGTWKFNRVDWVDGRVRKGSNNPAEEQEGALHWSYTPKTTGKIREIGPRDSVYDHMWVQVSDGTDSDIVRLLVELRGSDLATHNVALPPQHAPDPSMGTTAHIPTDSSPGAAPTLSPHKGDTEHVTTSVYYEGGMLNAWDTLNKPETWTRELNFGDSDTANWQLAVTYYLPDAPLKFNFDTDWNPNNGDRTLIDMPDITPQQLASVPNYNPNHPYYAETTHEPGDVPIRTDEIWETGTYKKITGHYGDFYIQRYDSHSARSEAVNEGVLHWYYKLAGDDPGSPYSHVHNHNPRHNLILRLDDNEYGVDVLHLQLYDNDGNKSEVRTIMVPIAGNSSNPLIAGINTDNIIRFWLDSYDNWFSFENPPTSRAASLFDPGPDGSQDDGPVSYDIA